MPHLPFPFFSPPSAGRRRRSFPRFLACGFGEKRLFFCALARADEAPGGVPRVPELARRQREVGERD